MKRMFCILAATIILSLFMTGCGERGRIGNGENGTITDNNTNSTQNATERRTETTTNSTDNNNNNNNDMNGTTDNNTNNNNNATQYTEQNTDTATQQGIAGRVGDAIDEGVSDLSDAITGQDNNTQPAQ